MRNRIERLRLYLAVSAGLLLAVLIGFMSTARYLKRHALSRLGSKLGIDIRSEANGFTVSQSLQGRTIYTLHAAKEIEHANGVIGLHDVSMILYGRTGDRADMVYGNEFEYDKNTGEVRAIGLVHIDLGGAGSGTHGSAAERELLAQGHGHPSRNPKLLHATTSGLVYVEKLGVVATSEPIDFESGEMKGHAVGADYNTDTGVLQLHSAVNVSGVSGNKPASITAAAAQLDDRGQRAVLSHARYATADQSADADHVVLHTRADNSFERVEADGNVHVRRGAANLDAAHADLRLGLKNKPQNVVFTGAVRYTSDQPTQQARGQAQGLQIAFNNDGSASHAAFTGAVHVIERTRPSEDPRQPWAVRDLTAESVETSFAATTRGSSEVRDAVARGNAHLTVVDNGGPTAARGRGTSDLAGDTLTAHLLPATAPKQPPRLDTVLAQGHTAIHQFSPNGIEQTSTSDMLEAHFRPAPAGAKTQLSTGTEELAAAVQTGNVHMTRKTPARPSSAPGKAAQAEEVQQVSAQRALYNGDTDRISLTGGVRLQQPDGLLLANQLAFDRATGDATADGSVRVTYLAAANTPQPGPEPVHVLAERAEMNHATGLATFFGRPARLWQGGSQIQAPVVELSRQEHTLAAHGDPQSRVANPVQTILVEAQGSTTGSRRSEQALKPGPPSPARSPTTPQVVRILSEGLLYSENDRKAQFNGPVEIQSGADTIRARSATAHLETPAARNSPVTKPVPLAGPVSLDGRIERVIATGDVVVEQPGRRASGNRLLYVARESSVLLTGLPDAQPKVVDTDRGTTVTAVAFRLHTEDDSIEALSSLPDDPTHAAVHTETPAKR